MDGFFGLGGEQMHRQTYRFDTDRVRTYLSADRRRMISLYQAPDAESVRLALHDASMHVDRVWAFRLFSG